MFLKLKSNILLKDLLLDFGVPGSLLRYLHITKLVNPEDEKSEVESQFYLAMHTDRIENFYCVLLETICSIDKMNKHQNEDIPKQLTPRGTNTVDVQHGSRVLYKRPAPLLEESSILRDIHSEGLVAIRNALPGRFGFRPWTLIYSTDKHGFSLRTFYTNASQWKCSIIFFEDTKGHVFGGYASDTWEIQDSYYGSGESFLFRLFPILDLYPWVGASSNNYFMLSKKDHFEMGGGFVSFCYFF